MRSLFAQTVAPSLPIMLRYLWGGALMLGLLLCIFVSIGAANAADNMADMPIPGVSNAPSPHMITLFFSYKPVEKTPEELTQKLLNKGNFSMKALKKALMPTAPVGFYAMYGGSFGQSDLNGQILFPRGDTGNTITVIVTTKIRPVFLGLNKTTITHFLTTPEAPSAWYTLTKSEPDAKKLVTWNIQKEEPSAARKIPPFAVIIFAKPETLSFSNHPTSAGENMILPTLMSTKKSGSSGNALSFLKISRYYAPVTFQYKIQPARYAQMVQPR